MGRGVRELIEISHRDVLVASHVRLHPVEAELAVWASQPKARPSRPQTVGRPVVRKVDSSGNVSFAGANYRVENGYRRQQVEVRVVGDTVEISGKGRVVRTHPSVMTRTGRMALSPIPAVGPAGSTPPPNPRGSVV